MDPHADHLIGLWAPSERPDQQEQVAADGTPGHQRMPAGGRLMEGAVVLVFRATESSGTVLFASGSESDTGALRVEATDDGRILLSHGTGETGATIETAADLFQPGDDVTVRYGWSAQTGARLEVENLSSGVTQAVSYDTQGLELSVPEDTEPEDGSVTRLAIYDADIVGQTAGPGVVSGTDGAETINVGYDDDPEGDRIDAGDATQPGAGPNDDIVDAGAGDDRVFGGRGNDVIYGGAGSDRLAGANGDDTIYGDRTLSGDPAPGSAPAPREAFRWSEAPGPDGDDEIEDDDSLLAGFQQDTGSATVRFSVLDGTRGETRFSENSQNVRDIDTGDDSINTQSALSSTTRGNGQNLAYQWRFDTPVENVSFRVNDIDSTGVVRILAFDENGAQVPIDLSAGSRVGLSDSGGATGNDTARSLGGGGRDASPEYSALVDIDGPVSRIVIQHAQGGRGASGISVSDIYFDVPPTYDDLIDGGDGNDTLIGELGDDILLGRKGDDTLLGGEGDDRISGGSGADVLSGGPGEGRDVLFGGADRDRIIDVGQGDRVDGGSGGDDFDTLDLTGTPGLDGAVLRFTSDDREDGVLTFFDADGVETGTLVFREIEQIVGGPTPICFTPGVRIATPQGLRSVEDLQQGDRVLTRDNGIQTVCWKGTRPMTTADFARRPDLRPIRIAKDALGPGMPERDIKVSPNHRVLVSNEQTQLYFDEREVLVAAKHLVGVPGVVVQHLWSTTYVHVMFEQHEVILSDGLWTESFQPGDYSLAGIAQAQRAELEYLFPEFADPAGVRDYAAARRSLKRFEAALLARSL
ncbi:Hint domain-containing protein [uncultured Roseobacter sp.]|uniref:Hint domain-containing protein n=1 Tax=uncultured Roseobacter sp. TaxID=114847 RepID=UPI002611DFFB|nr:Hint domain-containing protein [uncultured Roseobacter sp.]